MRFLLLAVLVGLALVVAAGVLYRRDNDAEIAQVLGMAPWAPEKEEKDDSLGAMAGRAVDLAGQAVDRVDAKRSLTDLLERAKVPLRPGEFVIVMIAGCL